MEETIETIFAIIAIFIAGLLFVGIFVLFFVNTNFTTNTEGTHTGYVTAVEKTGIFAKKYRVYFKTDKTSSQEDTYCLPQEKTELVEKLRSTQTEDKKITIFYNEKFTTGIFNPACGIDEIVSFK